MIKKYCLCLASLLLVLFIGSAAMAQAPKKPVAKPLVKYKPPVTQAFLGKFSGNTAVANAEEGKAAVTLPLTIVDDKKLAYTLSSYQFAYTRIGITEDEETGKTSPATDLVSDHFTVTPLPAIWQTNIAETLHKGETLYFFDIIAFDKQGRRFFAPELKITIQ